MVETYNQNSNPNMRRPVVKEEIVDFMRQRLQPVSGGLKELEDFARAENVPVIPHETVAYFRLLLESLQPEKILEIGTAIGFSITLLEGDAVDLLETLEDSYDLVFMDSAKSKYVVFLPQVLKRLNPGGLVLIDDVFQGGDVAKPFEDIKRGQRAIYRGLHSLFDATLDSPDLTASLLPLGDGLLMIRKK